MGDIPFFDTPLRALKGVGPQRERVLAHAGLATFGDLLSRLPFRYEDRASFRSVAGACEGEKMTVAGELLNCRLRWTGRRGFKIFEAVVRDDSGCLLCVWPNQPYRQDTLRAHQRVILHGQVVRYRGVLQLSSPDVEVVEDESGEPLHSRRIVPVYERAGPVTGRMQRVMVHDVLTRLPEEVDDLLPGSLRAGHGFPDRRTALAEAHFPPAGTPAALLEACRSPAQARLIFEEFFLFQCGLVSHRASGDLERKPLVPVVDERVRAAAKAVLPFPLTPGQRAALKEIVDDMRRPRQMNRLLQGDVGAGKTAVALLAAVVAIENGQQVAVMVPTEILAAQHRETIARWFDARGYRVGAPDRLDAAGRAPRDARGARERPASDRRRHARAHRGGRARSPGSASSVVDEQHRFGVVQRAALRAKGLRPDVLVMTATPIPRTLQLTIYGGLDVSVIRDLPPGRVPVQTDRAPGHAAGRGPRVHQAARWTPAARPASSIRWSRSRRRSTSRRPRPWPITSRRTSSSPTPSACCTAGWRRRPRTR